MLTSHTSSEEEQTLYLREFAQNIRNYNEGPQLLEDTADQHAFYRKLFYRQFFPSLPIPRSGLLIPLKKLFHSQCCRVFLKFLFNVGLENKLTRAPLLGLAKSLYHFCGCTSFFSPQLILKINQRIAMVLKLAMSKEKVNQFNYFLPKLGSNVDLCIYLT